MYKNFEDTDERLNELWKIFYLSNTFERLSKFFLSIEDYWKFFTLQNTFFLINSVIDHSFVEHFEMVFLPLNNSEIYYIKMGPIQTPKCILLIEYLLFLDL